MSSRQPHRCRRTHPLLPPRFRQSPRPHRRRPLQLSRFRRRAASCRRPCASASKNSGPRSLRHCRPTLCLASFSVQSSGSPIARRRRRHVRRHLLPARLDPVCPDNRRDQAVLPERGRRTPDRLVLDRHPVVRDHCPRSPFVRHSLVCRRARVSTRSAPACIVRPCRVRPWDGRHPVRAATRNRVHRAPRWLRRPLRGPLRWLKA
jgi:hypothetical protein